MSVTRRGFVKTLYAASRTALAGRLFAGELYGDVAPGTLNFAILGDWGRLGRPDQVQVAGAMAHACEAAKASFIFSVGDNFYEDCVAALDDPHWQRSYEQVYAAAPLQVPWYVILGNHDYHGNCEAQLEYGKTHSRWIMPARHYQQSFTIDAATQLDCFFIDTSPMIGEYEFNPMMLAIHTQDVPQQLAWLDQALGKSKAAWKFVVGHHPIYSAGSGHGSQQDLIRDLLPILQRNNIHAYFCGHDHDLQHLQTDALNMFVSGGGSEHRPTVPLPEAKFAEGISGFAMVAVRAGEFTVRLIDSNGSVLHSATIARSA